MPTAESPAKQPEPSSVLPPDDDAPKPTRFRWVVLALVFFAITINYIDRMVLGLLAPQYLKEPEGWLTESQFGYIGTAFGVSYALGQLFSGGLLDRVGVRIGYPIALAAWSLASMAHAAVRSALGFGIVRGVLGFTESPAYPAATKTLGEWFPKKERAFAMGLANAGACAGAILAPAAVLPVAAALGWQAAFIISGGVGLVWLVLWIPMYRRPADHPRVNKSELKHIHSDPPESSGKVRWARLVTYRQAWAFMLAKALTDPVWSFYLFWLPAFLKEQHKITGTQLILPMTVAYIIADIGSIFGGWLSSSLIKRGWAVNPARKITLLGCALAVTPVIAAPFVKDLWVAIGLVGLALAAHQGFSSNLYTLVPDMFPKRATASVAGLGGMCGYLGFGAFSAGTGLLLDWNGKNYIPVFIICGLAYLLAFAFIHLLAPKLEPAEFPEDDQSNGGSTDHGFTVLPR